jgi:hypothetical protein
MLLDGLMFGRCICPGTSSLWYPALLRVVDARESALFPEPLPPIRRGKDLPNVRNQASVSRRGAGKKRSGRNWAARTET